METMIDSSAQSHRSVRDGRASNVGDNKLGHNPFAAVVLGLLKLAFSLTFAVVAVIVTALVKAMILVGRIAVWITCLMWRTLFWMLPG